MISPIEKIVPIAAGTQSPEQTAGIGDTGVFGAIFQSAIDRVKEADAQKTEAEYLLATGQLDNPAALMNALSKNELAINLLVQLRNKALDAYSELTRISL